MPSSTTKPADFYRERVEKVLDAYLQSPDGVATQSNSALPPRDCDPRLLEAMRYSAIGAGKRMRAMLVYCAADACAEPANANFCDASAAAIELIHSYSLVHDDLPSMDDDDLRRGKPSNHKVFGEAVAILAGDGLQALAFEVLADSGDANTRDLQVKLIRELAQASGACGMVGGQAIDIAACRQAAEADALSRMHRLKTGALIVAATRMGGLCSEASITELDALTRYAQAVGLAFQVQDDILDVSSTAEQMGKSAGKDVAADKPTYVALLGLDGAQCEAQRLTAAALDAIHGFGNNATALRNLAHYAVKRDR